MRVVLVIQNDSVLIIVSILSKKDLQTPNESLKETNYNDKVTQFRLIK